MRRSLTREERLRRRSDIKRVFASPLSYRWKGLQMRMARNGLDHNRVLIVPTRKTGNAVQRNRTRRVGKEVYRNLKPRIQPGFDLAFILYPGNFSFQDRLDQFSQVLRRAELMA